MEVKVIDDFLPHDLYEELRDEIVFNDNFPLYVGDAVSHYKEHDEFSDENWNWYCTHQFYNRDKPMSGSCDRVLEIFEGALLNCRSLMRIKANFYPYTETLREHGKHADFDFPHYAAIYSLNTCNGFTRLSDGTKIDSVANRMLFFDGSTLHNSSTTTNAKGRYNINFNYL